MDLLHTLIMLNKHSVHPSSFMPPIRTIISALITPLTKSPKTYKFSNKAMAHEYAVLKQYNCNYDPLVQDHPNSDLSYGNEFRPVSVLEPLLHKHENWEKIANFLEIFFEYFHPTY